jgi:hypothetical protein
VAEDLPPALVAQHAVVDDDGAPALPVAQLHAKHAQLGEVLDEQLLDEVLVRGDGRDCCEQVAVAHLALVDVVGLDLAHVALLGEEELHLRVDLARPAEGHLLLAAVEECGRDFAWVDEDRARPGKVLVLEEPPLGLAQHVGERADLGHQLGRVALPVGKLDALHHGAVRTTRHQRGLEGRVDRVALRRARLARPIGDREPDVAVDHLARLLHELVALEAVELDGHFADQVVLPVCVGIIHVDHNAAGARRVGEVEALIPRRVERHRL